ncbi:MAG TPA: hypothetical protein VFM94_02135 [Solirubrobacterales bacterium]|nr:hypothetical protein [Solirubrobacterales bacterium]
MRREAGLLGSLMVVVLALAAAWAPAASADIIGPQNPNDPKPDSPWQAGTCTSDAGPCSVATPLQFFEQAAGHPPVGFTQFIVNTETGPPLGPTPIGNLRTVRVDLPAGLTVNPQSSPQQCELAPGESPAECATTAPDSKVGYSEVTATNPATGFSVPLPAADVYNVVPEPGEPARFGLSLLGNDVFLEADVAWESDYHEYFTIHVAKLDLPTLPLLGEFARIAKNRLVFDGNGEAPGDDGTFITTPTTCLGPAAPGSPFERVYSTWLRADSYEDQDPSFPNGSAFVESKIPRKPGEFETSPKDCDSIPFDPGIAVDPNTAQTDSPSGATVTATLSEVKNPTHGEASQGTSHVRSAAVTMPAGMGLNPSAASGLIACSDGQFNIGSRGSIACPPASRIGTVEVDTPPLPDGSLSGPVFVGKQLSSDPSSGNLYRIFVAAESSRYDISARLLGKVKADPVSGRLTTVFEGQDVDGITGANLPEGLPQVPFEAFRLKLNGGAKAALTSPPTCGPNTTTGLFVPWSAAQGIGPAGSDEGPSTDPPATPDGAFSLTSLPGGGACPKTLATRPFGPTFGADTNKPGAGDFSPLHMDIVRSDGNQELKGVDVTLPPGLTAKLAGVKYCPEASLAAAADNGGTSEAGSSSCPASSLIGVADIRTGSGPSPIQIGGKVFLAGPYRGAPLSLAVITPATAGPFDLGVVVVRVALFVDPRTAQVRAVSDPIPHVYGGALLDVRSVAVRLNRKQFTLNPTNCSPFSFGGSLLGGGANPVDPAAFVPVAVSAPFKAAGCEKLDFKPKLFLRLFGATRRAKNPRLRAVLVPNKGDANIARAATILPRSLILDQGNLSKVCTRVQFAAHDCPKNSIYGFARAFSPLLDDPLEGPLFLRSSDNPLPDLVAALHGQVDVELSSRTDSTRGRIRNTFDVVPDVPVSKFILTLRGGPKGLLVNSRNQCPRKGAARKAKGAQSSKVRRGKSQRVIVRFKGQNGKKKKLRPRLRVPCGKKSKGRAGS